MKVFVIGMTGKRLCPTSPSKAKKLLKTGKAHVYRRVPFTIRLDYKTGGSAPPLKLGIDTGEQHIGTAVCNDATVFCKSEIELIKSMEKKKRLEKRKIYRRSRRYRKTRYRHPKFRFRTKRIYVEGGYRKRKGGKMVLRHWKKVPNTVMTNRHEGWLPPSIESKVKHHIDWINRYMDVLPDGTMLGIEVARFDIARMKDPSIRGELYQFGRMYGRENTKAYVLAKFDYTCPICKKKFDRDRKPRMHHVTMRKNAATDNPDEYAPVCVLCHSGEEHLPGGVLDKLAKECRRREYREPTFMNILRRRLFETYPEAEFTYGNITNADRKMLGLEKTHANDAVSIAKHGAKKVIDCEDTVYYRQVHRKKRSLHEATPRKGKKEPNHTAKRNVKNVPYVGKFHINDKVKGPDGNIGFITGLTGSAAYITDFIGEYIYPEGKDYKQHTLSSLRYVHHCGNWITSSVSGAAVSHD